MNQLVLPTRFEHLEKVDNLVSGWEQVKLAIRPDCRDDRSMLKAKIAIESGLNDAAINYIWNLAIFDLQRKIYAYGIEYFASAINWDKSPLKIQDDLREVNDYQIISGAFSLGIIANESHFFLQQCREIRNNFSTAHYPMGELDKLETFNFIKNCIKYVLTFDLPVPGLQIKDLIERLTLERLESADEIKIIVENQSSKMYAPTLHNLFSIFIKQDCPANLKHNINLLAPYLWEIVSDEVKGSIAAKFVSIRDIKGKDSANEALQFLKNVKGVEYIPETFKEIIFKKHAQLLIDAHNNTNNFYTEPNYAKDLASLGNEIPLSAQYTYVKAIILSYIGNCYGVSHMAQIYNTKMIKDFTQTSIRMLFNIITKDIDVLRELMSHKPAERINEMMNLIKDKTMLSEQKNIFEILTKDKPDKNISFFIDKYWNIVKK